MSCTHTAPLMSLKFVLSVNTKGILNDLLNFENMKTLGFENVIFWHFVYIASKLHSNFIIYL